MSQAKTRLGRRNFLLAVGAGGVASAATIVAKAVPQAPAAADDKKKTRGYHATAHIRSYYNSTKV